MLDPIRRLLAEASKAKQTRAFWQTATEILSGAAGGARVELTYKGLTESGTLEAGGTMLLLNWATAIEVSSAMLLLFSEFLRRYVVPGMEAPR